MKTPLVRFSTRSLLLIVTVGCVLLGLHVKAAKTQKNAVEAIRDFGGWVRYDYQVPAEAAEDLAFSVVPSGESWVRKWILGKLGVDFFHNVVAVSLARSQEQPGSRSHNSNGSSQGVAILLLQASQANDSNLDLLSGMRNLRRLELSAALELSDQGIVHLANLSNLRFLRIEDASLSEKSLAIIGQLKTLKQLILTSDNLTDAGVERLSGLSQLERLELAINRLFFSNVTDRGLIAISRLSRLKYLELSARSFSDLGLSHLNHLKVLEKLFLWNSDTNSIGDAGLAAWLG